MKEGNRRRACKERNCETKEGSVKKVFLKKTHSARREDELDKKKREDVRDSRDVQSLIAISKVRDSQQAFL
jgi:hypothetical protein